MPRGDRDRARISSKPLKGLSAKRPRLGLRGLDETEGDRHTGQTSDIVNAELLHDVGAMDVGGSSGDIEAGGDFLGRIALRNELEDLAFTRGQALDGQVGVLNGQHLGHALNDGRTVIGLSPGHDSKRALHFGKAGGLLHDAFGLGHEDSFEARQIEVTTDDDDLRLGELLLHSLDDLDAIQSRQLKVSDQDVWFDVQGFAKTVSAVAAKTSNFEVHLGRDEITEKIPKEHLVFDDINFLHNRFLGCRRLSWAGRSGERHEFSVTQSYRL